MPSVFLMRLLKKVQQLCDHFSRTPNYTVISDSFDRSLTATANDNFNYTVSDLNGQAVQGDATKTWVTYAPANNGITLVASTNGSTMGIIQTAGSNGRRIYLMQDLGVTDQTVSAKVTALPTSNQAGQYLVARGSNYSGGGTSFATEIYLYWGQNGNAYLAASYQNGSAGYNATYWGTVAAGDVIMLVVTGTTSVIARVYKNGTLMLTSSAITCEATATKCGMSGSGWDNYVPGTVGADGTSGRWDDFGASYEVPTVPLGGVLVPANVYTWTNRLGSFVSDGLLAKVATTATASGVTGAITTITPITGDGTLSAVLSTTSAGLVFRFTDTSNYWYATATQLIKVVAGASTVVSTYGTALTADTTLTVTLTGPTIAVTASANSPALSITDTFNQTAKQMGIYGSVVGAQLNNWEFDASSLALDSPWVMQSGQWQIENGQLVATALNVQAPIGTAPFGQSNVAFARYPTNTPTIDISVDVTITGRLTSPVTVNSMAVQVLASSTNDLTVQSMAVQVLITGA